MSATTDMEKFLEMCIINRALDTRNESQFNLAQGGVNVIEEQPAEDNFSRMRHILKGFVDDIDNNMAVYLMGFVRKKAIELKSLKNKGA